MYTTDKSNTPRFLAVVINGERVLKFEAGNNWQEITALADQFHMASANKAERIGATPLELCLMFVRESHGYGEPIDTQLTQASALSLLAGTGEWEELIRADPPCIELRITDRPDGTPTVERRPCLE